MASTSPPPECRPPAIFLMGPTASGKTGLAAALLEHLPAEIISVDSAQVYRGMDIGAAKPDAELLARAPHHLLDVRDPAEPYSAAEFAADAGALMYDISRRGRIPLLVGGTMLYFRVLLQGLADLPPADPAVREEIAAEAAEKGWPELHRQLAELDPETAAALHPNHSQRIQRALEIHRLTGRPASVLKREQGFSAGGLQPVADDYDVTRIALMPGDRKFLHDRIDRRFEIMLEQGLVEEVKRLKQRGDLAAEMPSVRAVGYRQVWAYLGGEIDYGTMVQRAQAASRQLAKRQLTWLRRWPDCHVLYIDDGHGREVPLNSLVENALKILPGGPIYN